VFGGGDVSVREGALIASFTGMSVISIDYRMPPDHPQPAAVLDVTTVYRALLKSHKASAIGMGGTSAGGGLTLASVHYLKSQALPVPGALYLGTPWADLSKSSDTLYTNESVDRFLVTYDGLLAAAATLYAGGEDLKDPMISPVYGNFKGFPPTYLVSGTRDMLLSDTARVHRKLRVAGVEADLNVYEGLSHAEYAIVVGSPEWTQVYSELAAFLIRHLSTLP
jgi:monoterpene epsilon-lactone hydrolase